MTVYRGKIQSAPPTPGRRRRLWMFLLLWFTGLLPELILHIAAAKDAASLWNAGMVLPGLFALVPALILFAVFCLLPSRKSIQVLTMVYGFTVFLLCASQLVYYRIFGCFYSVYSMANGAQVLQFWDIALKTILKNLPALLAMLIPFLVTGIWGSRFLPDAAISRTLVCLIPAFAAAAAQICLVLSLPLFGADGK